MNVTPITGYLRIESPSAHIAAFSNFEDLSIFFHGEMDKKKIMVNDILFSKGIHYKVVEIETHLIKREIKRGSLAHDFSIEIIYRVVEEKNDHHKSLAMEQG